METYFGINYEFDIPTIHKRIDEQVKSNVPAYICAPDGNVLNMAFNNAEYRKVINGSIFSICDSSWAPIFIKWIHRRRYRQYCGSDIFMDIIRSRKYRMFFIGTNRRILDALQKSLINENPHLAKMQFHELPFCEADEFDYEAIAETINNDNADIIWVALGAPKQELFMNRLKPHLRRGVIIAVGAVFNFHCKLDDVPGRSPRWMRSLHIEFIHRLLREPRKQSKRCWSILVTLPRILYSEYKKRKNSTYTKNS